MTEYNDPEQTTPDDKWEALRLERPWLPPSKLPPPKPRPVPELGWCARCKRANPRPGYPDDQDGHDWVEGMDQYAYVAGVVCPDCLTPTERQKLEVAALDLLVYGKAGLDAFDTGVFITPEDADEEEL